MAVARLVRRGGEHEIALDAAALENARRGRGFFWLDVEGAAEEDVRALGAAFDFHPLSVANSIDFGQRAKLESYDGYVFFVVYGWSPDEEGFAEVHCYYSTRFLVTIHRKPLPALADARERVRKGLETSSPPILVLHDVVDGLVAAFLGPLETLNDRLEEIEVEMVREPRSEQVEEVLAMRRRLAGLRKAIVPQRDLFGRLAGGSADIPGMTREAERYFRDVHDDLFRLSEIMDASRDLMSGALDVYLSANSNRLGEVSKQLTVIATIFLPLTFITGFFGQNFRWLVDEIGSWQTFVLLGLGLQLLCVAAIYGLFRRRGWF